MVRLEEIAEIIEQRAPLHTQESWDNSGWQIRVGNPEITRVLVALEVNGEVAAEAENCGAQLIVCHHPLIFGGIRSVDDKNVTGNIICRLVQKGISVYATHTPFDKCEGGNNDYLADLLGLAEIGLIPGDESGICRMGNLAQPKTVREIINGLGDKTGQDVRSYRLIGNPETRIARIGMCTGAGAEFMDAAAAAGCGLFITGDVKYHTAHHGRDLGLAVLDMGHFGSEQIFTENMASLLRDAQKTCEVLESRVCLNPFTIVDWRNRIAE